MVNEAADELEAIDRDIRLSVEVLRVRVDLHMAAKQWNLVIAVAKPVCEASPKDEGAWIAWAYALREMQRVKEAQEVLLQAEPLHGNTCGVLHYNLACYACLLGNMQEARRRLSIAYKFDEHWSVSALDDEDLRALWDDITTR
jgi:Flp pilus assembly protein TadD